MVIKFQSYKFKRFVELGGDAVFTVWWMYLMLLNYTLQIVNMINFIFHVFTTIFKSGGKKTKKLWDMIKVSHVYWSPKRKRMKEQSNALEKI